MKNDQTALIRPSVDGDIEAITQIYRHHVQTGVASFEEVPPDVAQMATRRAHIVERRLPYLVAQIDQQVVGYSYASAYRARIAYRYTLEDTVYLMPDAVGMGIGTQLLAQLVEQCTELGYRQMIGIIADSEHLASIRLHEKTGFRRIGVLQSVGYKFDRWIETVFMQRALGEADRTQPLADPVGYLR